MVIKISIDEQYTKPVAIGMPFVLYQELALSFILSSKMQTRASGVK